MERTLRWRVMRQVIVLYLFSCRHRSHKEILLKISKQLYLIYYFSQVFERKLFCNLIVIVNGCTMWTWNSSNFLNFLAWDNTQYMLWAKESCDSGATNWWICVPLIETPVPVYTSSVMSCSISFEFVMLMRVYSIGIFGYCGLVGTFWSYRDFLVIKNFQVL